MRNGIRACRRKSLQVCLVFAMIVALVIPPTSVFAEDSSVEEVANEHVVVYIAKDSGRFVIETVQGHPQRNDDDAALLFGGKQPKTSFATFRIDGEDYIFGNNYG